MTKLSIYQGPLEEKKKKKYKQKPRKYKDRMKGINSVDRKIKKSN